MAAGEPETAEAVEDEAPVVRVEWARDGAGFARDVLLRRVIAELELRGFEVHVEGRRSSPSVASGPAPLGVVVLNPAQGAASASLRWIPSGAEMELAESVVLQPGEDAPEVAAVLIAELVVATVENSGLSEPVPQDEVPPEPAAVPPEQAPPVAPRWRLGVGLALLTSPGGLGVLLGPHASASASLGPARRFGVGMDATASALTAGVSGPDREHRIGLATLRAHALWWPRPTRRWSPSLGLGGGTLIAWADPGGVTAVGVLSALGDLSVGLTERVAIWAGARVQLALPRVEVRVQQRVLATAGQPLVDVGVGLRVRG